MTESPAPPTPDRVSETGQSPESSQGAHANQGPANAPPSLPQLIRSALEAYKQVPVPKRQPALTDLLLRLKQELPRLDAEHAARQRVADQLSLRNQDAETLRLKGLAEMRRVYERRRSLTWPELPEWGRPRRGFVEIDAERVASIKADG